MASARGRTTRRFRTLAANVRMRRRPCCLCGQPIDYSLPTDDPQSFTVEHIKALSTHPHLAEDPANMDAAHRACNSQRGNREAPPTIGATSRQW